MQIRRGMLIKQLVLASFFSTICIGVSPVYSKLSDNAREAIVMEAYYALSKKKMNGTSTNIQNGHYYGDWNYIGSDEPGARSDYDYVKGIIKGWSSDWTSDGKPPESKGWCGETCDYCKAGKDYDFYKNIEGYGFAGGIGRGGQCRFFAFLVLVRALGQDEVKSIPTYKEMSAASKSIDEVQPGDVIFKGTSHTALAVDIQRENGKLKSLTVIEANYTNDPKDKLCLPLPGVASWWSLNGERIATRTMTQSSQWNAYKVWAGSSYYKTKYTTTQPIIFNIDDTGSMSNDIKNAIKAAKKVMREEDAAGRHHLYTLMTFKDGPEIIRCKTYDIDHMSSCLDSLVASGGAGCQESSYLAIRGAAKFIPKSDIYVITDASSNSYGKDNTFADKGELALTRKVLKDNKCTLHSIIYGDCGWWSLTSSMFDGEERFCRSNYSRSQAFTELGSVPNPAGTEGFNWLSHETGGLYFNISSYDTEDATEMILRSSTFDSTIVVYDREGSADYNIPVDTSCRELQIILNGDEGSNLDIEIRDPDNTLIDTPSDDISIIAVSHSSFYKITGFSFKNGNWTAKVRGSGSYRIIATALTTNPMDYTGDTSVALGSNLYVSSTFADPVPGISFQLVNLDGSFASEAPMSSVDGLNYTGSLIMQKVGSYRFKSSNSDSYQRMFSGVINVNTVDVVGSSDKTGAPGTVVTQQFDVKNLGTVQETYDIFAKSSLGWADLSQLPATISVPQSGANSIIIPVTVPMDATKELIDKLSLQAVSHSDPTISDSGEARTGVLLNGSTICSTVLDGQGTDTDSFTFSGASRETVTMRLKAVGDATPGINSQESKVTLVLSKAGRVITKDTAGLPKVMTVTLPSSGVYDVSVVEQKWGGKPGFTGDYCLTLESSKKGWQSLGPTDNVE